MKKLICLVFALAIVMAGVPASILSYAEEPDQPAAAVEDTVAAAEGKATEGEELIDEEENVDEDSDGEGARPGLSLDQEVDGISVGLEADEGVFPEDVSLSVRKVSSSEQKKIDKALDSQRGDSAGVAFSYSFDIKVLDTDGNEVQPAEGKDVRLTFAADEVADESLSTRVYHLEDNDKKLDATELDVTTEGDAATVTTDGFSYYTVEFTYGDKQYVLEGDGVVKLDELLASIGIEGEVKGTTVSNSELFDVIMGTEKGVNRITRFEKGKARKVPVNDPEGTVRYVVSYKAFDTEEWMDVQMEDGATYHVIVTDAITGNNTNHDEIDGVSQGVGHHFAKDIPVATIWIDDRIINTSVESRHVGNHESEGWELYFRPGELMDSSSSKYDPGFQIDTSGAGQAIDGSQDSLGKVGYRGSHFIVYDSSKKALDGSVEVQKKDGSGTAYQSYNYFEGEVGSYVYTNAAVYTDANGQEQVGDVWITYYNPMITIQTRPDESAAAVWSNVNVGLFGANMLTTGKDKANDRCYGLDIQVRPTVRDKSGNIVDGTFYFPMVHLNVCRGNEGDTGLPWRQLYGSNPDLDNYDESVHLYSEQAKLKDGLLENKAKEKVFIPGGEGDIYNYIPNIDLNETEKEYTIHPSYGNNDLASDTISLPTGDVKAGNSFYFGFLSLAQNGDFSLGYNSSSTKNTSGMETYVLSGTEFNYRLRSSTETKPSDDVPNPQPDTGGTIQTTHYGNHSGDLHDGGDVIGPSTIATAYGQDVVYTMTPKDGYTLKEVWVWNDKNRTDTFPDVPDGMKTDSNSKRIFSGDGTNDTYETFDDNGDGKPDRYTFAFNDIGSYNAIHVVWEKTLLEVSKTTTGSGKDDPDTFNFRIRIKRQGNPVAYVSTGDSSIDGRFTEITGSTGWYGFSLTNGETLQIPTTWTYAGDEYEVEEIPKANNSYGTTYDWDIVGDPSKSGTLEAGKTAHADFTNNRKKDADPGKTTLTVKKVWRSDDKNLRPKNVTMTIEKEDAIGIDPADFKRAIMDLVGYRVTSVKYGTMSAYNAARGKGNVKTIEAEDSWGTGEVYVWKDGNEIYFYSESRIYLVGSAANLFGDTPSNGANSFRSLKDISGLAHVHTDYVTDMSGMFFDCISIEDLSPLTNWNTANVTSMSKMFGSSNPNTGQNYMKYTSVEPLRHWQTQNVTSMRWLLRGAKGLSDLEPLQGWDTRRNTDLTQAFFRTNTGNSSNKGYLEKWNVQSVLANVKNEKNEIIGFDQTFRYSSGGSTPGSSALPLWVNNTAYPRPGSWDSNGTYTPSSGAKTQPAEYGKNEKDAVFGNHEKEVKSLTAHDVDPQDSNTWIYTFEVPDDGAEWDVYETLGKAYENYYSVSAAYDNNKEGKDKITSPDTTGVGNKANPYKGAEPGSTTTITNTGEKHKLTIQKDLSEGELPGGADENTFRFNLKLTYGTKVVRLDPGQEKVLVDAGKLIYHEATGTYTLTLIGETAEVFELPAGVKYEVSEIDPVSPWKLVSSNHTSGTLDQDREASFTNSHENYLVVRKIWEGDDYNGTIFPTRPTDPAALGIQVTDSEGTEYKNPEVSFMDDPADYWLYEFNIPDSRTVPDDGVAEKTPPEHYEQTIERVNKKVFTVTNTLKQHSLRVEKETAGNERGEFDFEVRFWIENSTGQRHPVKIGHSQIVNTDDGMEGEFVFENGIEIDGKDVSGVYEYINGELKGQTLHSDGAMPTVEQLQHILSVMQGVNAGDTDEQFTHQHKAMKDGEQLTLHSFNLTWHGQNTELVYVEQPDYVISDMFNNGRRIDWYIIPDPDHDEVINIRTPYELRAAATEDGPAQMPAEISEVSKGVYHFTLKNGGHIQFNHLPAGLSYEVTEYKKEGWEQISRTDNYSDVLYKNEMVVFGNGSKKGKLVIQKATDFDEEGTFLFRGLFGRPLDESKISGTDAAPVYPAGTGPVTSDVDEVTEHADRVEYTVGDVTYTVEKAGVKIGDNYADILNIDYPYAFTLKETADGKTYSMYYEFIPTTDEESGETTYKLSVTSATYEFELKNGGKATFADIPFGTAYDVEEIDIPKGWELSSLTNDTNGNLRADGHMNVGTAKQPLAEGATDTISYTFTNSGPAIYVTDEYRTITRYITYTEYTASGKRVATTVKQTIKIKRTKTENKRTGKITYTDWVIVEGSAGAVTSPDYPGWKPDKASVGEWAFDQNDPRDEWVHVVYQPVKKKGNSGGDNGNGSSGSGTGTGDSMNVLLWIALFAAAGIALLAAVLRRRRS